MLKKILLMLFSLCMLVIVTACGSDGDDTGDNGGTIPDNGGTIPGDGGSTPDDGGTIPSEITIKGTVAEGSPLVEVTVIFKDKNGVSFSTTTDNNGKYEATVEMATPILLRASKDNKTYYSIATEEGTANIHPFTDLIIRNWYSAKDMNLDDEFNSEGNLSHIPTIGEINIIENVVKEILADFLTATGLDPAEFNLITTEFDANHKGFDKVIDVIKVKYYEDSVEIVPVDNETEGEPLGTMQLNKPLSSLDEMKDEINSRLSAFKATLNDKGCEILTTDIAVYMEEEFLFMGRDKDGITNVFKYYFLGCEEGDNEPGNEITEIKLQNIKKYANDNNSEIVTGIVRIKAKEKSTLVEEWENIIMSFKKVGDLWVLAGDNMPVELELYVDYSKQYRATGEPWYRKSLDVVVSDFGGEVSSVKIYGPGIDPLGIEIPLTCINGNPLGPEFQGVYCEDEEEIAKEFKKENYWDRNDYQDYDYELSQPPYVGAVYTVKIDNNEYKITMLPAPENLAYPEFRNLGSYAESHTLSFTDGKMIIKGEVFTPLFVDEVPAPWVNLWSGNYVEDWGEIIGEVDCDWDETPVLNKYNPFTCEIPETYEDQNVTIGVLGQDANQELPGGTEVEVYWDLIR